MLLVLLTSPSALHAQNRHYPHNDLASINCTSCHDIHNGLPSLLIPHTSIYPDDTPANALCWSCHNDLIAPFQNTHSSSNTSAQYGSWSVECRTCHDPHVQDQWAAYGPASLLDSGNSDAIDAFSLTSLGAGWSPNEFAVLLVIPNLNATTQSYRITGNTADTLTVAGPMDLGNITAGDPFGIAYGKLIEGSIPTPNSGSKENRFFRPVGPNSFADGDAVYDGVCEVCHTQTVYHRNDDSGGNHTHNVGVTCTSCHQHINGFMGMGSGAHTTHVTAQYGPRLDCVDCHGGNQPPMLADGVGLAATTVCDNCHSANGVANAKIYWPNPGSSEGSAGSWAIVAGLESFCGSCHDSDPGNTAQDGSGTDAPNVMGDNATFGFYRTGHGLAAGNYARLSWQEAAQAGNPAASRNCGDCHQLTSQHFNNGASRLKTGFENDATNTNCINCHLPGTADAPPDFFTTSADFENSAHDLTNPLTAAPMLCTDCHDVHGAAGAFTGMTLADGEQLCFGCHTNGLLQNNAISGPGLADDIQQAFSFADNAKHTLGASFKIGAENYTLECVSCHNVHIVTGKYWAADLGESPVTRFSTLSAPNRNLAVWGDGAGEKMDDYGGTYRTPNGDPFDGSQLPDYNTFCLDCHEPMPDPGAEAGAHGQIQFGGDPHGLNSANSPNGGGTCPDRGTCGKAKGWNGDDCLGDQATCWPVLTRGKGDQLWSRGPYNHEERIAGSNFALSCTDCHEAHGSSVRSAIRTNPNNGTGTTTWNNMCNNCHYYYSDWHAGMSCGNASCHVSDGSDRMAYTGTDSIHRMGNRYGTGATRTFDPTLVLDMRFENNLNDSGTWRMHGKWYDAAAGTFTAGKSGQGIVLNGDQLVQVGTRNASWSTDESAHGTWKYTELKYNGTLEAWVNPTDDPGTEFSIFTKHVGYGNGGYAFTLREIGGTLRASFNCQIDDNAGSQGGAAGVRGAYSSVSVPLDEWTYLAATFDANGPDRDPTDPTVGRIRIYVNGEDVTTSDSSGNWMQPGPNETSIFAYTENSPWNQGICYSGTWCASEFSIGGFTWQNGFVGRIDEAKVWNITKDASYYDSQVAPLIVSVQVTLGGSTLMVTFSEGVYSETGATGDLIPGDFTFTDSAGLTISSVTHTAGDSTAALTLSSLLDCTDMGSATLAAKDGASIYDNVNSAMGTDPSLLTSLFWIAGVETVTGYDRLFVDFSEAVWSSPGQTGTLVPTDLALTDGDGNGAKTILNVSHSAGASTAAVTLSAPVTASDLGSDALSAVVCSIYDATDTAMAEDPVTVTALPGTPSISSVLGVAGHNKLAVWFSERVYANPDTTGALQSGDFLLSASGQSIIAVDHAPGSVTATLILDSPIVAGDIGTATLAATGGSIFDETGYPAPSDEIVTLANGLVSSIESVQGLAGSDKLKVTFKSQVYSNDDETGLLIPTDFLLTDTAGDNPRSISAVFHGAGNRVAVITMSAVLLAADLETDTLAAVSSSIFGPSAGNFPLGTAPVTITAQTPPAIDRVEGAAGYNQLIVAFGEGVYTSPNQSGALVPADFTDSDPAWTITNVQHVAGQSNAILTLDSPLAVGDIGVDTIAAVSGGIYNSIDNPVGPTAVPIEGNDCPTWGTSFPIENEPLNSPTTGDNTGLLTGTLSNPAFSFPAADNDWFNGDENQATVIDISNSACLSSTRALTIEARVFPTEVDRGVGDNTFNRIFERRRNIFVTILNTDYRGDDIPARANKASIEVKVRVPNGAGVPPRHTCPHPQWPADPYVGNDVRAHQISSDIDLWPIVNGHWYQIRVVFNSDKANLAASNGTPVDIFIDDQGADGLNSPNPTPGDPSLNPSYEQWPGYANASKSINESSSCRWGALPGDFIEFRSDSSHIGSNWANSGQQFAGRIDWVTWKPVADYVGVDDPPN